MKTFFLISFLLINLLSFSQEFQKKFLDINKNEITKKQFYKQNDSKTNLDVFIQSDSLIIGMLVRRKNQGKLDKKQSKQLTEYLSRISGEKIDSSKTLVINYLSSTPKTPYFGKVSQWTIFKNDYLKSLHKIPNIYQIWINNPDNQNLKYFHNDRINWIEDSNRIIENIFFPFEFEFGSFVVINSNGNYISYYAEYGKEEVLTITKECIKLK
ncbi:hypothetical protein ACFQ3R_04690 [Mesonia ostreae]|uniref:Uncharacterized protein n=1 Tax=Mesonia ostreae TaxID=861110 RepID=A0ABU2KK75_9FLAO|nr:hypothetical protein [Mesonia ostreae]MDT0295111.1 hypothetical protein [Mesonia ostreae]